MNKSKTPEQLKRDACNLAFRNNQKTTNGKTYHYHTVLGKFPLQFQRPFYKLERVEKTSKGFRVVILTSFTKTGKKLGWGKGSDLSHTADGPGIIVTFNFPIGEESVVSEVWQLFGKTMAEAKVDGNNIIIETCEELQKPIFQNRKSRLVKSEGETETEDPVVSLARRFREELDDLIGSK